MRRRLSLLIMVLISLGQLANTIFNVVSRGMGIGDYLWVWKESLCTVRGIDVIFAIKNHMIVDGIEMPGASATMPYARILANFIHPGFLSMNYAAKYGFFLYVFALLIMIFILYKKLSKELRVEKQYLILMVVLAVLSPWYWTDVFLSWNNGALFALFLVISVYIVDDYEYISGVLLAFAMIKPQIAALFYISFFLKRKYKVILVSIVILCLSWGIYLILMGGNPIIQMIDILKQSEGRNANFIWFGIFDPITKMGKSGTIAIVYSMIFGIALVTLLSLGILKSTFSGDTLLYYSIPAVMSTIWCYKSTSDLVILVLPNIMLLYIIIKYDVGFGFWCLLNSALVVFNVKIFSGIIRRIIHYDWLFGVNMDAYARTIMFLLIYGIIIYKLRGVRKLRRITNEASD